MMYGRYIYRLLLTFLCFSIVAELAGQVDSTEESEKAKLDTSYFKNEKDDWNLVESVIRNNTKAVQILLDRDVSPDAKSGIGNSALIYAVEQGNVEIMTLLIEAGSDVNFTGFEGGSPLFTSIFYNDFQAAKLLLENGANPNKKDDFGVTPLIYASATNQYQSADLLLFYEADAKVSDKKGNDPLITAVTFENLETSDVLLQNGLDPDVQDNKGNSPAIIATQRANHDLLQLLIDYEANVNLANNKNYTPLAYALTYRDVKTSKLLIEHGADPNHEIEKGRNLSDLARHSENDTLVELIKESGGKNLPGLDFSEFDMSFGNSFNSSDYFISFRGGLRDTKHDFFFETGIDYRPFLLRIQTVVDDTLFQFRERRIGWSHSIGKYQTLYESKSGMKLALYGSLNGYLSFPGYQGYSSLPGVSYKVIPSGGVAVIGRYIGLKAGADWYNFKDKLDNGLKANISIFFRIAYPEVRYDRKEIYWE